MAFTELCCRSGGSNLNAGTRLGDSTEPGTTASLTYASGTWVSATRVFTPAGGANPITDGVAVGDFASVYPNAATVGVFIGRVSARTSTTITIDGTAKIGTSPVDGTSNTTLKIGGAWKGPNGAEIFPFNLIASTLISATGIFPRVNFKNDADYVVSASLATTATQIVFQGYTSTYGDGGRATFDGGATGAAYTLVNLNGASQVFDSIIVKNNGDTGNANGIHMSGARAVMSRCVAHDVRGFGCNAAANCSMVECEAYSCNQSNTATQGGIGLVGAQALRCISHDNTGSNSNGFVVSGSCALVDCIADTNAANGFLITSVAAVFISGCDAYANTSVGINMTQQLAIYIENCNLIKNSTYGIFANTNAGGFIRNCGFGAGTQANTLGTTNTLGTIVELGSVTYAADVTPWRDPATGDFRINLATAKGAGRGAFTETQSSYTGTVGYPDIGAARHFLDKARARYLIGI